jgi:predicted nucleic acid-binding protein
VIAYLDANIVIYLVEQDPTWGPRATARITILRAGGDRIAVSDLNRTECLVGPFASGDAALASLFQAFFSNPTVQVFPLTAAVCERAARVRATHGFRPLDALHLAAAMEHGCGLFLTNDAQLVRFPDIPVEVLT